MRGGFADVYIDEDNSGTLSAGDIQVEDDVFLVANHSGKANPASGSPAILPPILAGSDPGGDGHGVGVNDDNAPIRTPAANGVAGVSSSGLLSVP